jgi:putative transposase
VFRLLLWAIAAIFRPKTLLIAENLCLRQQLLVLQRRYPRPRLSNADRRFWILASRWFGGWRRPLRIVRPETVLRWRRRGWRAYWTRLSHPPVKRGRRPLPQELRALIRRMAAENWLWGQKRIQAELARLGFKVSARTVAKYMRPQPRAIPGLEKIPKAARTEYLGPRFLLRSHNSIPDALCLLRDPACQ